LFPGEGESLAAILVYDDGTSRDVSADASWRSNNFAAAEVDTGNVNAVAPGTALVSASFGDYFASATITVSAAHVQSLAIMPAMLALARGETQQLVLVATLDDSTSRDVTSRASWTTSDPAVVSATSSGRVGAVTGGASGSATIQAGYQGRIATLAVSVP
jgi:uncharacterized protein YjdB